jgi:hypothetical protein
MKSFIHYLTEATKNETGIHLEGSIDASFCKKLESLGNVKSVSGYLDLNNTSLKNLPNGLQIAEYLDLSDNTALETLPIGLRVGRNLFLTRCTSLKNLPNGLEVGESLYLRDCTALTELPSDLQVGGNLYLANCTSLKSLPRSLVVDGDLSLTGCTALTELPIGLQVGRDLDLRGTKIEMLPMASEIKRYIYNAPKEMIDFYSGYKEFKGKFKRN